MYLSSSLRDTNTNEGKKKVLDNANTFESSTLTHKQTRTYLRMEFYWPAGLMRMGKFRVYQACRTCPSWNPSREFLDAPTESSSGNGRGGVGHYVCCVASQVEAMGLTKQERMGGVVRRAPIAWQAREEASTVQVIFCGYCCILAG